MADKQQDPKALGLSVYMEVAKYTSPLAQRRAQKAIVSGEEDPKRIQERSGKSTISRPEGRLFWLHAANMADLLALLDLTGRLRAVFPDVSFLVTSAERINDAVMQVRLPAHTIHQYAPFDTPQATSAFLQHWRPDLLVWADDRLMPILLQSTAEQRIPALFINAGVPRKTARRLRWLPGAAAAVLNNFSAILAVSRDSVRELVKLGVAQSKITMAGRLSEGTAPMPFDERARAQIAKMLHGRPVWLAAHTAPSEEDLILHAHRIAQRSAHRLISIISPLSGDQIGPLKQKLAKSGLTVAYRSDLAKLTPTTDILFGDVPDELGLWYRIASVSFIGNSLTAPGGGQNPCEAAALGSAIIHGPRVGNYADSYFRLAKAGAAIEVGSTESLAEAIGELISPDKAAEMAHAAWATNSQGAEVTDMVLKAVHDALGIEEMPS